MFVGGYASGGACSYAGVPGTAPADAPVGRHRLRRDPGTSSGGVCSYAAGAWLVALQALLMGGR